MIKTLTFTILILLILTISPFFINYTNGDGEKVGQIVKLNKIGFLNKTWEGELIRGGMSNGSGSFSTQPFDFTIENENLALDAKKYLENQTSVKIEYTYKEFYSPFSSENHGCFVTKIEPVK